MSENKENEEIEIVTGDGTNLDISPVYDHLNAVKPKPKNDDDKNKKIIIPQVKKKEEKKK